MTTRTYSILVWLLPVLMVVGGRDLLVSGAESAWSSYTALRDASGRIDAVNRQVRELSAMKNDFQRLAEKKAAIASSLFGAKSEAGLYDLLMQKALESQASIVEVSPRPRRSDAGFVELPLSLSVSGSFDNIIRFISAVENVSRLMRVEEVAMAKDRSGRLVADLLLIAYMYSDTLGAPRQNHRGEVVARGEYKASLQQALAVIIAAPVSQYEPAGRRDAFGSVASADTEKPAAPFQANDETENTSGLTLKGILWKEPPIAIVETLDGRTCIVRQGETVSGYRISSISRSDVVITGPRGNHVLQQYTEQ
ncbi:MAG: type 4a pilus biogenesis protein PilO [Chitinispirillaceae bacterium]|jgi:Tfp pilus assembly protein PilO|nr:type 4a pilus biogenesis protein PilO [Chitinispirillaceae bacterium]